jgi:hypothetical protein
MSATLDEFPATSGRRYDGWNPRCHRFQAAESERFVPSRWKHQNVVFSVQIRHSREWDVSHEIYYCPQPCCFALQFFGVFGVTLSCDRQRDCAFGKAGLKFSDRCEHMMNAFVAMKLPRVEQAYVFAQ